MLCILEVYSCDLTIGPHLLRPLNVVQGMFERPMRVLMHAHHGAKRLCMYVCMYVDTYEYMHINQWTQLQPATSAPLSPLVSCTPRSKDGSTLFASQLHSQVKRKHTHKQINGWTLTVFRVGSAPLLIRYAPSSTKPLAKERCSRPSPKSF